MKPLKGIRILDMSRAIAGPLCSQILADLGAEVIKVESPGLGDETRGWPPFKAEQMGAVFLSVNRNKRSVVIDLKTPEGRAALHRMVLHADVAIESFKTGVAEKLEIDAATLCALNERLIHCSISGFGRTGPLRGAPGYDVVLQAFCGIMALSGEEGGGHIRSPVSPIDQMTSSHAAIGIMAALTERARTGKGGAVQASLYDTAMAFQRYNLQMYWIDGRHQPKCGSGHQSLCPYQAFEALDGPIMIGVANDNLWRKFCAIANLHDMSEHPDYCTNAQRSRNRAAVIARVQNVIATQTVEYWYEQMSAADIPCSPINRLDQLLDHPHTEATGIVTDYAHAQVGEIKGIAQPFLLNGERNASSTPPPLHGEHTDEVLLQFGFSEEEIKALQAIHSSV